VYNVGPVFGPRLVDASPAQWQMMAWLAQPGQRTWARACGDHRGPGASDDAAHSGALVNEVGSGRWCEHGANSGSQSGKVLGARAHRKTLATVMGGDSTSAVSVLRRRCPRWSVAAVGGSLSSGGRRKRVRHL
jgi:hypothetical protein